MLAQFYSELSVEPSFCKENSALRDDYFLPTRFTTDLNKSNVSVTTASASRAAPLLAYKTTSKSAFESDPEVLMLLRNKKHRLASRLATTSTRPHNAAYQQRDATEFENDYLNIFSCRIKKEAAAADELKNERGETAYVRTLDVADVNIHDDTIESTHLDSDYAKSPIFPSDAYGSRPNISTHSRGIYTKVFQINLNLYSFYRQLRA